MLIVFKYLYINPLSTYILNGIPFPLTSIPPKKWVRLFEVELQKPRNLSVHESGEFEHGGGGGVYAILLQSDTL